MTSDNASPSREPDAGSISLADANCIVLRLDGGGRIISLNPFGLDFFGYREPEILCVGNDISDRKAFETVLEAARLQLTATIQEQNARLKETNTRRRKEVEERKKTQQALSESRDRYRLLSSGYSQNGEAARKLMQNGSGFIQKPFRLSSPSKKVRELLGAAQDENP